MTTLSASNWTAPQIERVNEPLIGDERTILAGYLDWHRQTLLYKCAGLTAKPLKTAAVEPSNLTLLGPIRHMTEVERGWFTVRAPGLPENLLYCSREGPDGHFDDVAAADP